MWGQRADTKKNKRNRWSLLCSFFRRVVASEKALVPLVSDTEGFPTATTKRNTSQASHVAVMLVRAPKRCCRQSAVVLSSCLGQTPVWKQLGGSRQAFSTDDLPRIAANHTPLSPISFLERSAKVFENSPAVIHGDRQYTYSELGERSRRLASALRAHGISKGETVSAVMTNTPEMVEAHYGVPMSGGVLNTINVRLDAAAIAFILQHAETKVLLTDCEFAPVVKQALDILKQQGKHIPKVVDVADTESPDSYEGDRLSNVALTYEDLLAGGDPSMEFSWPDDEWDTLALNYTSGTTGNPKGVLYHHRGAFLNATSNSLVWGLNQGFRYLWTLPMFHCNGWCFPWTVTAHGGVHVCLRKVTAKGIYDAFADHGVTHLCGAPIIMQMLLDATPEDRRDFHQNIKMMTAAAPPPAIILKRMEEMGIDVTHTYGLTEVYGPVTVCVKKDEWKEHCEETQANLNARQGVRYPMLEGLMVGDPETLEPVEPDGESIGEIFMRGNVVMKGYFKNPEETKKSFKGGWFHTGDLAVTYPDGYVKIMDRSKDIIISGGENVSSVEVENVLYKHERVNGCAVVAKPCEKWGEVPCAFIELAGAGSSGTHIEKELEELKAEILEHCRANLPGFKVPKVIQFGELPKTNVGKIQKFKLREMAKSM
eukprot:jgi/Bigna1/85154/estExt_fgenesh1_pg.C_20318